MRRQLLARFGVKRLFQQRITQVRVARPFSLDFLRLVCYWASLNLGAFTNRTQDPELGRFVGRVKSRLRESVPPKYGKLVPYLDLLKYERKGLYPQLVFVFARTFRREMTPQQEDNLVKLAVSVESLGICCGMHSVIDRLGTGVTGLPWVIERSVSDKKIVLGGDFFSSLASIESSATGINEVPLYMSLLIEQYCVNYYKREEYKARIKNHGIQSIKLSEVLELHFNECDPVEHVLRATCHAVGISLDPELNTLLSLIVTTQIQMLKLVRNLVKFANHGSTGEIDQLSLLPYVEGRVLNGRADAILLVREAIGVIETLVAYLKELMCKQAQGKEVLALLPAIEQILRRNA